MKVGDKVILSDAGMDAYGEADKWNPWFTLGTIEDPGRDFMEGFKFFVKWSNGHANAYRTGELQVIQC